MRILITGSTGFVGRHLVPQLLNTGHCVLEITRNLQKSTELFGDRTDKYLINDDQDAFSKKLFKFQPEIVIHLAAYLNSGDDYAIQQKLLESNVFFLCRLLDALKSTNVQLFLNTGTFAEYAKNDGNFQASYFYAATKTASRTFVDYYSRTYNFKQVTVVPYTIYGGFDTQKKIIDIIYDSLNNEIASALTSGNQILDFIHINDVTEFYLEVVRNIDLIPNQFSFHLGTGNGHTIRELSRMLENITSMKANINWGERAYRPNDIMYAVADVVSNKRVFNWNAGIQLEEGVKLYVDSK